MVTCGPALSWHRHRAPECCKGVESDRAQPRQIAREKLCAGLRIVHRGMRGVIADAKRLTAIREPQPTGAKADQIGGVA